MYDRFMEQEAIPIYEDTCGVEDVTRLPRQHWPRLGGPATFIELRGPREAERGEFVGEVPGGKANFRMGQGKLVRTPEEYPLPAGQREPAAGDILCYHDRAQGHERSE